MVTAALSVLGYRPRETVPAFGFLYLLAVGILALGQWSNAVRYNLEPPLVALVVWLILANLNVLPRRLDAGFRVQFYDAEEGRWPRRADRHLGFVLSVLVFGGYWSQLGR